MELPENVKQVKLTKKGLPDKRAETSKKNLDKGKSIIKQALEKIKEKPKIPTVYSSDEYSTDEEIVEIEIPEKENISSVYVEPVSLPVLERKITEKPNDIDSSYTFTFEKKLKDSIDDLNNIYNNKFTLLEEQTKLTKDELKILREQNQTLKKQMKNDFRTHAGIMNQEMYLKF